MSGCIVISKKRSLVQLETKGFYYCQVTSIEAPLYVSTIYLFGEANFFCVAEC